MRYIVKSVVCDYGVYEKTDNGEQLKVICDSLSNAELIADILNTDLENTKYKAIERSEYEFIKHQLVETMDRVAELDKINTDLRSKIDKAIKEIEDLEMAHCIQIMDREDIVTTCLEILKRNIGE